MGHSQSKSVLEFSPSSRRSGNENREPRQRPSSSGARLNNEPHLSQKILRSLKELDSRFLHQVPSSKQRGNGASNVQSRSKHSPRVPGPRPQRNSSQIQRKRNSQDSKHSVKRTKVKSSNKHSQPVLNISPPPRPARPQRDQLDDILDYYKSPISNIYPTPNQKPQIMPKNLFPATMATPLLSPDHAGPSRPRVRHDSAGPHCRPHKSELAQALSDAVAELYNATNMVNQSIHDKSESHKSVHQSTLLDLSPEILLSLQQACDNIVQRLDHIHAGVRNLDTVLADSVLVAYGQILIAGADVLFAQEMVNGFYGWDGDQRTPALTASFTDALNNAVKLLQTIEEQLPRDHLNILPPAQNTDSSLYPSLPHVDIDGTPLPLLNNLFSKPSELHTKPPKRNGGLWEVGQIASVTYPEIPLPTLEDPSQQKRDFEQSQSEFVPVREKPAHVSISGQSSTHSAPPLPSQPVLSNLSNLPEDTQASLEPGSPASRRDSSGRHAEKASAAKKRKSAFERSSKAYQFPDTVTRTRPIFNLPKETDPLAFKSATGADLVEFNVKDADGKDIKDRQWFAAALPESIKKDELSKSLIRRQAAETLLADPRSLQLQYHIDDLDIPGHTHAKGWKLRIGITLDPYIRLIVNNKEAHILDYNASNENKANVTIKSIRHRIRTQLNIPKHQKIAVSYSGHILKDDSMSLKETGLLSDRVSQGLKPLFLTLVVEVNEKDCVVCGDTLSKSKFPRKITERCQHKANTCRGCIRTWIKTSLSDAGWDRISCPECKVILEHADVKTHASAKQFARYDTLAFRAALSAMPDFRWCLNSSCPAGQIHSAGVDGPIFKCNECDAQHCVQHEIEWHAGETCTQYDYRISGKKKRDEEAASEKIIRETTKTCPECKAPIEKNDGCDHMTCRKCKYEFCWICLAAYDPIRRQGNRMHNTTCTHYRR